MNQALRAHSLFQKDKDYIVRNGEVVIIDEFTGRMMPGRRYSEGLHQALEAKEQVQVQPENQTLASITFQNYFRLYGKLAGMTGTAATEANEFLDIYKLEVVEIPTNLPSAAWTRTTRSTGQPTRSTRRWSGRSRLRPRKASRCWSAPRRSRSPSISPTSWSSRATRLSTSNVRTPWSPCTAPRARASLPRCSPC